VPVAGEKTGIRMAFFQSVLALFSFGWQPRFLRRLLAGRGGVRVNW
jgi:hypothetical protein